MDSSHRWKCSFDVHSGSYMNTFDPVETCSSVVHKPKQELARYSGDHGANWQMAGVSIR